jgi:AcrR family transcriptional regulator
VSARGTGAPARRGPGRGAPGRRRTPRAVRERQMLEVASRIFSERGYERVSMDEIAAALGLTKPMLYSYFGSKEGLFAACAERAGAELRAELREVADRRELAPDRRLWLGVRRVFAFVEEHAEGWRLLYPEGGQPSGPLGAGARASRDAMADLLGGLFAATARGEGVGEQAAAQVESLAHAFTAATIAAVSRWNERRDEPGELAALRLMNLAWNGFGGLLAGRLWLPED